MASASELISNRGDANLGLSSDSRIPVGTNTDLDKLTRIGDQIMYQNMAQNKHLFDQKVKDRDALLSQISSGDIKVGDLLEEDMPYVKQGLEDLDKAWGDMIRKGKNDLGAQTGYKKALREAQDRVTQAQGRKVFYDFESTALAKETLPRKQSARKSNLDSAIKGGFWKDLTPYQQTQDLDIQKSILSTAERITTQYTDPKTLTKGTRTVFDYGKTLAKNKDNFLNNVEVRHDQGQLMNEIQKLSPPDFIEEVDLINNRIREYNDFNGLTRGQEGFVSNVEYEVDPRTGMAHIRESLPDFAAKYTLAHEKPFSSTTADTDFKLAETIRHNKAMEGIAATRARAYADLTRKKINKMTQEEKDIKGFWDGVIKHVREKVTEGGLKDVILWDNLPPGYRRMGAVGAKGESVELKPFEEIRGDGSVLKYFKTNYRNTSSGDDVNKAFLGEKYKEYKGVGGKGNYDQYVQKLIKDGVIALEVQGSNGSGDYESALQSARAISGKIGSGKEERVYEQIEESEFE